MKNAQVLDNFLKGLEGSNLRNLKTVKKTYTNHDGREIEYTILLHYGHFDICYKIDDEIIINTEYKSKTTRIIQNALIRKAQQLYHIDAYETNDAVEQERMLIEILEEEK
jgi:hypothetical protein